MDLFKNRGVKAVTTMVVCIAVVIGGVFGYHVWDNRYTFNEEFASAVNVTQESAKLSVSFCQPVMSSVKIRKNEVEVVLNNDKMSGFIVGEGPNRGIVVRFSDRLTVLMNRILMEDGKTEIVVISSINNSIILSKSQNCEDIASFLEKVQSEE